MTYEQLCLQIKENDLLVPGEFFYLLPGMIEFMYNGCGAEWMPEITRKALSWLYRHYDAAVHIHDIRFEIADKFRIAIFRNVVVVSASPTSTAAAPQSCPGLP